MVNQLIQDPAKLPKTVTLLEGFEKLGFDRGAKAFSKLEKVNSELQGILNGSKIEDSLVNTKKIMELSSSIYSRGISFLEETARIVKQSGVGELFELTKENEELESELTRYKDSKPSMYLLVQERIDKNKKNIELVKKSSDRVDELLCNVGLCIDSLRGISLELPELVSHKAKDDFDKVMLELNTRVEFAQRVKAEYERQGI